MNLNFYSKATLTLRSLGKSFAFCLIAVLLFVNNSQAQSASALNFDGVNDYVTVPVKPALNITQSLTIEAWIKPTKASGVQDVISKSSASSSNSFIFPRTPGGWSNLEFLLNINGAGWKTLRVPFGADKLGTWHHVAATYDGYTMRIFVDGVQAGSYDFAGTITVNNNALILGNQTGLNEYYGGSVDDARIFNRALSACEILSSMNCELTGSEAGLVAYYKFNQGLLGLANPLETTLYDASPTGANGTLVNFGILNTGLLSNWSDGIVSAVSCPAFVPTTVTAGSLLALVPVSGTINLTAVSQPGATYSWTGPNNFTSNQQNPSIEGVGINASGTYTVTATVNGCAGSASTTIVVAPRASGLSFDGVNDMVVVPNSPILNSPTISVEAWIYPTASQSLVQNVVAKTNYAENTGFKFPKTNDKWNSFSFELSVDKQWKALTANFPTAAMNKWNHLAATYDGYFMRIYLNGVLMGSMEVTGTYTPSENSMLIGNNEGRIEFFKGYVDEVRVWNRAVSQCEIINNMKTCELNGDNNGLANQVALGAYYRFNQGLINVNNTAYSTLADSSGHNLHGTLTNFALTGVESNWVEGKVYGLCDYFPLPLLTASANGSVFQTGSTAKLFAAYGNNDVYNWDGPASFATTTQNPVLNNVQITQAGTYTVTTPYVNCVVTSSVRIKVSDLPQIVAAGPTTFCPSGSVSLSTASVGTAYQWFLNDVAINGATANNYTATLGGSYSVKVTSGTDVIVSAPLVVTVAPDVVAPVADVATLPTLHLTAPATVTTVPTATDACRGPINGTTTSPLTFTHGGTYTITWSYNDGYGNISTQTQTVEVEASADVTPPVITVPNNITVNNATGICGATVNFTATAVDETSAATVTYSQNPGTQFPVGTTTVTVTATDESGNVATRSFTVTVVDVQVPVITAPANISSATGSNINIGTATATDNCGTPVITRSAVPATFPLGTTTITWTATDAAGNVATATQTVTVTDVTPPVLVGVPANVSVNCGILPAVPVVTATDNSGITPVVTLTSVTSGNTVIRTWTATDAAGNTASASQVITLVPDTQAPVLTVPANINSTTGTGITIGTATATDNCGTPVVTRSNTPATFPLGITTITWTATDAAGNTTTKTQTVTVTDVTAPVLVGVPANTTATCGILPAVPTVTATDNFDANPVVTYTTVTNGNTVTRTWTAKDASGNTSSASQVITLVAAATPVIAGPASGSTVTQNPLTAALNFNVFLQNGMSFGNGQSAGPVAMGGDLTIAGDYSVSNNSAGTFKVSNVPVTLLMGGKVVYQSGNNVNINQNGYVKIGNATNSYVWYKDQNNAYSPIRITPGNNYNGSPRLNLQANAQTLNVSATSNPVFESNLIDFATAFTQLKAAATSMSAMTDNANITNPNGGVIAHTGLPNQVKINLATGMNVLNLSAADLNAVQNFTYNNQPDATHVLVINVNAPGSFSWNVWNSGGIGDANTKYILYNFYNTTSLTVQGNGSVMGTLFAPNATIAKTNSQNITGQIVGQSFAHTSGANTYNTFAGTITSGTTTVIAAGSNVTRATNTGSCTYAVSGSEFDATATASDNCGVLTLGYTLTGATTGSGSSLSNVSLNAGTTTITWTATNGTATATYSFTVTVTGNIPAAPVVAVANNCGTSTITASATTGSLLWSNGATGSSITVADAGTYTVTQTVNGCVSTAGSATAAPKAVQAAPVVTVTNNCGSTTLTSNVSGTWSNGATGTSITVTTAGSYTVTAVNAGGCSAATATPVTVNTNPTVSAITGNTSVVAGSSIQLANATTGGVWSSSANATVNASGLVTGVTAGTATITYTVTTGAGCSTAVTAQVTVTPAPPACTAPAFTSAIANISVNAASTQCTAAATYTASVTGTTPTLTYTFSGATTASGNGTGSGSIFNMGTTTVTIKAVNNCGTVSTSFTVTVKDVTAPNAITKNITVALDANGQATVTPAQVNNGSSDNCSAVTLAFKSATTSTPSVTGTICATVDENGTLNLTAPAGATITSIDFASYGTPNGTCGNFTLNNACNAANSKSIVEGYALGQNSVSIPATNDVFGDPCSGTYKRLYVQATYTLNATAGTNIVTNGDFTSNTNGWTITNIDNVGGWKSTGGNPGGYVLLNSNGAAETDPTLTQTLTGLVPGQWYTVSGVRNNIEAGLYGTASALSFGVLIDGNVILSQANTCKAVWVPFSVQFKATSATHILSIAAEMNGDDTQYGVDNISVTAVATTTTTASTAGSLSFDCSNKGANTVTLAVTDASGNTSYQNATVTVVDNMAPIVTAVPAQTFCGTAGSFTVPALGTSDNCAVTSVTYTVTGATSRTGTGSNASGTFNVGTSTITWTVKDASGNTATSATTVVLGGGPVATIAASGASADFCSELVLTGSSSVSGASYKWVSNGNVVGTASQYSLGQGSAEGTYQLYVTSANGCTSNPASYTFNKQNLLSSYTILATSAAVFGKYAKVSSGSVGVTSSWGYAYFKGSTAVNGANSFVKAPYIYKTSSDNITKSVSGVASVTGIPAMQYNTSNANIYSNYSTAQNATVTLSGNYKTLTIRKGTYATLSGTVFGTIDLEEGASVRFTNTTLNIDKLLVEDGAKDGYYSYVRFAPNSSVRVSTLVSIGSQVLVNPDNYKVTFFMGDNRCDAERFTVKGADTKVIANIIMPSGKLLVTSTDCDDDSRSNCGHGSHLALLCPHRYHNHKACDHKAHNTSDCNDDVYMTGTFVVEYVESQGNTVVWNSFTCGSTPVSVAMSAKPAPAATVNAQSVTAETSVTATSEEELKITVMPNPSTTYFTLKFESRYETPLNMRVMDANGRVVDAQSKIGSNSTIRVGANYASGTYFAEITQGGTRKVVQLIKVRG